MPITVLCPHGHKLTAKETLAGKRVKCPKCGEVVKIPVPDSPQPAPGLVLDSEPEQPAPSDESSFDWLSSGSGSSDAAAASTGQADPLAESDPLFGSDPLAGDPLASDPLASDPLASDPLALDPLAGDPLADSGSESPLDWLSDATPLENIPAATTSLPSTPLMAARPLSSPQAKAAAAPAPASAKLNMTMVIALGSGGVVFGFVAVAVLGWLLFGGGGDQEIAAAGPDPNASAPATAPDVESPDAAAPMTPEPAVADTGTESTATDAPENTVPETQPEPAAPVRQAQPWDLKPLQLDQRIAGFDLPAASWAAAYDEVSGRLAVTHDEQGILFYDLDDVLAGKLEPAAKIPTTGPPAAICLKPLPDRRVFVIASQDLPGLTLVDAESLEVAKKIEPSEPSLIQYLTGSQNPQDPYVYFTRSSKDAEPGRMSRINLLTHEQDGKTQMEFADVVISRDGDRLFARPNSTADGVAGDWSQIQAYRNAAGADPIAKWARNYTAAPPVSLRGKVALNNYIFDPTFQITLAGLEYSPGAEFMKRPVIFGLSKNGLIFASANNYAQQAAIPLPGSWMRGERSVRSNDPRARHEASPVLESAFAELLADDSRQLGILVSSNNLVLAPLDKAQLPQEPSLYVSTRLPETIAPEETLEVEIELESEVQGATFEYVPNADWLPDERVRLLGTLPPGEPSPRSLEFQYVPSVQQNFVMLKSYEPLKGIKFPFNLRVGNEVMKAVRYDKGKLMVARDNPLVHGGSERIAVIDGQGREVNTAPAAEVPLGKPFSLAAAMSSQQEIIFVNDLRPFLGEKMPFRVQIGDEQMNVTQVDEFKTALIVKRTEPVSHSVSSQAWVLSGDSATPARPNLPVVEGRTFRWKPREDQLGKHTIRMRARAGKVSHEWFWDVTVARAAKALPFQVAGIEQQRGTNLAVIWGQTVLPELQTSESSEPNKYFIGMYDVAKKEVLGYQQVDQPIMSATLDASGIYAALTAFDMEPKADRDAENARQRAMKQVTPTKIVRLDTKTFKVAAEGPLPDHCPRIRVIAGKYLAAFDRWSGATYRFEIPGLKPIEPIKTGYPIPIAGQLQDGWVWDGVVWDSAMKKPQLMLFPVHFDLDPITSMTGSEMMTQQGTVFIHTEGAYACTWCPMNQNLPGQYRLLEQPAGLTCEDGFLHAYSWSAASQERVGSDIKPNSVQIIDVNRAFPSGRGRRPEKVSGYVNEANGQVNVALLGKLYSVPVDKLVKSEPSFRLEELQEEFVLPAGKPAKLKYSAPNAVRYRLELWRQRPHFRDDEPAVTAESTDGFFELSADALPLSTVAATVEYAKKIIPPFQQLVGRKPTGVVYPVFVTVVAEHGDGQKAGLSHCYLVETPWKRN